MQLATGWTASSSNTMAPPHTPPRCQEPPATHSAGLAHGEGPGSPRALLPHPRAPVFTAGPGPAASHAVSGSHLLLGFTAGLVDRVLVLFGGLARVLLLLVVFGRLRGEGGEGERRMGRSAAGSGEGPPALRDPLPPSTLSSTPGDTVPPARARRGAHHAAAAAAPPRCRPNIFP